MTAASTSLTRQLTGLIRSKPVSAEDLDQAALFLLDALANMVAGQNSEPGRILSAWMASGQGNATDTARRAFYLGGLCHILETDDLHRDSVVHPGCVVVPAAWVLARALNADGPALLRAVLHGFEATTRVGMAVGPAHYRIWHNTATCGPFGAAMASASLLGLDETQTVNALGNAGSQSAGLWEFLESGAMTKHLHAGHAAEAGLRAAELAQFGFTGPATILEGEKGFFRAACPDAILGNVLARREEPWQLTRTSIKPWPSCRHTHPSIDAGLELAGRLASDGLGWADIEQAEAEVYEATLDVCDRPNPQTDYEAKFSIQHCIAAALSGRPVDFAAFADEARRQLADLRAKIVARIAEPYRSAYPAAWGAGLTVRTRDGRIYEARRTHALGDPEAPLGRQAMIDKAEMLLRHGGFAEPLPWIEKILALPEDGALVPELPV